MFAVALVLVMEAVPFYSDYFFSYPSRAVADDYFNGNKPMAYRTIMQIANEKFFLDKEDSMDATFARFFQMAYKYNGTIQLIEPSNRFELKSGDLLLTRRQTKYEDGFEEMAIIPEIAEGIRGHYSILRKQ